jgi:hypothetical protein
MKICFLQDITDFHCNCYVQHVWKTIVITDHWAKLLHMQSPPPHYGVFVGSQEKLDVKTCGEAITHSGNLVDFLDLSSILIMCIYLQKLLGLNLQNPENSGH